jgi:effector-binding domain-containing protein
MSVSYGTVASWIDERGHRIVGPHWEVYLNSPVDTPESDLLTEIMFPIDAEGEA